VPGNIAISVKDVVKQYKVRHEKGRTLKEAFLRQRIYSETINALNHVSFDVAKGTTLGLIGSNGSGKSTILKMIAGTSRPNSGKVEVSGRISALLELGAGFHPDFTGKENVFLDGIILGLSRKQIEARFDEIVDFAEMEEFIDAPAKTYSSGMFMRLAFAVAISVDPDILLIDEVLAVGDASFQRKCLARIDQLKNKGKTLVFVSHGMEQVRQLCDQAVWLDRGSVGALGNTDRVIDQYIESVFEKDEARISAAEAGKDGAEDENRWGTRRAVIDEVNLLDGTGAKRHYFNTGEAMKIQVRYNSRERAEEPVIGIIIRTSDGTICFGSNTQTLGDAPALLPETGALELEFEELPLLPGIYDVTAILQNEDSTETFDYHDRKYNFEVTGGLPYEIGISHLPYRWLHWPSAE
jgi:ABC-type polysaccharide/polyol phosphate transport system ATPase subunit